MENKICLITKKKIVKEESKTIIYSGQKLVVSKEAIYMLSKKLGEEVIQSITVESL